LDTHKVTARTTFSSFPVILSLISSWMATSVHCFVLECVFQPVWAFQPSDPTFTTLTPRPLWHAKSAGHVRLFFISCDFELDHDEWRLPSIVLSLECFWQVKALQPSDLYTNKRLLWDTLTRIKFCWAKMTFFLFWAWISSMNATSVHGFVSNVFWQSEQVFQPSDPTFTNKRYLRLPLLKPCWAMYDFSYFLWFWAWSHHEWRFPSMVLSLKCFQPVSKPSTIRSHYK
jgi:hypothetical protein